MRTLVASSPCVLLFPGNIFIVVVSFSKYWQCDGRSGGEWCRPNYSTPIFSFYKKNLREAYPIGGHSINKEWCVRRGKREMWQPCYERQISLFLKQILLHWTISKLYMFLLQWINNVLWYYMNMLQLLCGWQHGGREFLVPCAMLLLIGTEGVT